MKLCYFPHEVLKTDCLYLKSWGNLDCKLISILLYFFVGERKGLLLPKALEVKLNH